MVYFHISLKAEVRSYQVDNKG